MTFVFDSVSSDAFYHVRLYSSSFVHFAQDSDNDWHLKAALDLPAGALLCAPLFLSFRAPLNQAGLLPSGIRELEVRVLGKLAQVQLGTGDQETVPSASEASHHRTPTRTTQ